jgi:hypothetical protein
MINANHFREMYEELGINIDKLGCIMLDLDGSQIPKIQDESVLYFTTHPDRTWIRGFVGAKPHMTLLYGLMASGRTSWKNEVDKVLDGWSVDAVNIKQVSYFESPYEDEPYYCLVGHVLITSNILEGHRRLEFLPHINTFPEYKAHVTLAYIQKDPDVREELITYFSSHLYQEQNNSLPVIGLNYGK